jgi:hypothetical protein
MRSPPKPSLTLPPMPEHTGWSVHSLPDTGGCYTCRFAVERFGRPFCEVHKIVPSRPLEGCAGREREVGCDDEEFWVKK